MKIFSNTVGVIQIISAGIIIYLYRGDTTTAIPVICGAFAFFNVLNLFSKNRLLSIVLMAFNIILLVGSVALLYRATLLY
jgi:hypothetical protein